MRRNDDNDEIIQITGTNIISFEKAFTAPRGQDLGLDFNVHRTLMIGDSLANTYIPFIAPFSGQVNNIEGKKVIFYDFFYNKNDYKPRYAGARHRSPRRTRNAVTGRLETRPHISSDPTDRMFEIKKLKYDEVLYALSTYIIPRIFETDTFMFQAGKGILFEFDDETKACKLLMVLAVRGDYALKSKSDNDNNQLDVDNFTLFIHKDFMTDERYKLVYKKLKSEYIEEALDLGIHVTYTNNIEGKLYKNSAKKMKFKTIPEMNLFLDKVNDTLYNYLKV